MSHTFMETGSEVKTFDKDCICPGDLACADECVGACDRRVAQIQHLYEYGNLSASEYVELGKQYRLLLKRRRYWKTMAVIANKMRNEAYEKNGLQRICDGCAAVLEDMDEKGASQLRFFRLALEKKRQKETTDE